MSYSSDVDALHAHAPEFRQGNIVVSGLVTDRRGELVTQGSEVQPWTAAVAKMVIAPLPLRPVVEKARLAWRGDLFLGVSMPVSPLGRENPFTIAAYDPVFLYPLPPALDASGYFEGLRAILEGDGGSPDANFQKFAMAVRAFNPSREEVEAVTAAIADVVDVFKGIAGKRGGALVNVFRLRALMLGAPC